MEISTLVNKFRSMVETGKVTLHFNGKEVAIKEVNLIQAVMPINDKISIELESV